MSLKLSFAKLLSKLLPKSFYLRLIFFLKTGDRLHLNHPKTFNEKLQWKKLYEYDPIHSIIADKIAVRDYVSEKIGKEFLIPIYNVYSKIEEIDFKNLPDSFVLKSNNGSGKILIIDNQKKIIDKAIRNTVRKWLKDDYYTWTKERQYKHINTKIFAEKLLVSEDGSIPNDYKFHCFSGKVEAIQVDRNRFSDPYRGFFTTNWEIMPFTKGPGNSNICNIKIPEYEPIPKGLNRMIELAEVISSDFDYVRVDFYNIGINIYFGEITLHPASGFTRFYPKEFNRKWGKLIMNPKG